MYHAFNAIFTAIDFLSFMKKFTAIFLLTVIVFSQTKGQFFENFDDGNFTSNPAWSGDVVSFTINTSLQLQSANTTANGAFYLSTPSNTATQAQWEFFVNLKFSTSGANYVDVFLMSDVAILPGIANGYFVRIGGTPDEISLYRTDAGVATKIIDGADGRSDLGSNNQIGVKVIRSGNLWTLSDSVVGATPLQLTEGSISDATYNTSAFFGIAVKQSTASFFGKHYFDNIYAGAIVLDVTPPLLLSSTLVSPQQLLLTFNEALDKTTAETAANYSVTQGVGAPISVMQQSNTSQVLLSFSNAFTDSTTYIVTVNNVTDVAGNTINNDTISFTYIAPKIKTLVVTGAQTLDVTFTEPVDASTAQLVGNYIADNGLGNPVVANLDGVNAALVHLTFASAMSSGVTNTLTINNITTANGWPLLPNNNGTFTYHAPVIVVEGDIVINEIMAAPTGTLGLPNYEYAELYNASNKTIDLAGFTFADASGSSGAMGTFILAPHMYVIICSSTAAAALNVFGNTLAVTSFPSLNNTGDNLVLYAPTGLPIDIVDYTDAWYADPNKTSGYALEKIEANYPCQLQANWRASMATIGGTPGQINSVAGTFTDTVAPTITALNISGTTALTLTWSEPVTTATATITSNYTVNQGVGNPVTVSINTNTVTLTFANAWQVNVLYQLTTNNITDCSNNTLLQELPFAQTDTAKPGDVLINEILFNPYTGSYDFVEVYNVSQKIIDLKTLQIANYKLENDSIDQQYTLVNNSTLLMPQTYMALTENTNDIKSRYPQASANKLLQIINLPTFNDDEGKVAILSQQKILDAFRYRDDFHYPLIVDVEGVSLERISIQKATQDSTNWQSAAKTVGYATPGYKNSQAINGLNTGATITVNPEIFSPDEDGYNDVLSLSYKLNEPGMVANVTVYDSRGRLVQYLARNTLMAENTTLYWNGINTDNQKAPLGIYIIYSELFNAKGDVSKYKNTAVVAGQFR